MKYRRFDPRLAKHRLHLLRDALRLNADLGDCRGFEVGAALEGVKRATPDAHSWVNSEIVRRVGSYLASNYAGAQRRVGIGSVRSHEVTVRGPEDSECNRIRRDCLEAIGLIAEELAAEFKALNWKLPSGQSGCTLCAAQRLPGISGGMTICIGPAMRQVLEELRAAGWQIKEDHAVRTIRADAMEDTIAWLREQDIFGPT